MPSPDPVRDDDPRRHGPECRGCRRPLSYASRARILPPRALPAPARCSWDWVVRFLVPGAPPTATWIPAITGVPFHLAGPACSRRSLLRRLSHSKTIDADSRARDLLPSWLARRARGFLLVYRGGSFHRTSQVPTASGSTESVVRLCTAGPHCPHPVRSSRVYRGRTVPATSISELWARADVCDEDDCGARAGDLERADGYKGGAMHERELASSSPRTAGMADTHARCFPSLASRRITNMLRCPVRDADCGPSKI